MMVPDPPPSDPQMMTPVAVVSRVSQLVRFSKRTPPPVMVIPAADASPPPATESPDAVNVDVADPVFRMDPAMVMPAALWSWDAVMPPLKVFVALTVETSEPPAMVRPPVVIRRSLTPIPPRSVLVAVFV